MFELPKASCVPVSPDPPPPHPIPKQAAKRLNAAQNVLYVAWTVILGVHNIKRSRFGNFDV